MTTVTADIAVSLGQADRACHPRDVALTPDVIDSGASSGEGGVMTDYNDIAKRYIDAWNRTDAAARRAAVDELYTEDARYVDPLAVAEGREAIASMIGAAQEQFPGFVFTLAGPVDGHHNQARFGWELGPAGAPAPVVGFDVAVTDDDGRIRTVLGFLDKVPAAS